MQIESPDMKGLDSKDLVFSLAAMYLMVGSRSLTIIITPREEELIREGDFVTPMGDKLLQGIESWTARLGFKLSFDRYEWIQEERRFELSVAGLLPIHLRPI